jgi:asparagine synthase (glutamine-hydrolysing)
MAWLRPPTRQALLARLAENERQRPLSFAESVRRIPLRRTQVLLARNRHVLAAEHDVARSSPLLDAGVVDALARHGGRLGPGDRTAALRSIAGDLLPDAVVSRSGKAFFNEAYMGGHLERYARTWNGEGLDRELVDPDELRRSWVSGERNGLTAALAQAAWLGVHGDAGVSEGTGAATNLRSR